MKLVISKSKTTKVKDEYRKTIYSIETEVQDERLEDERVRLESQIDSWLASKTKPLEQHEKGFCCDCGKPVKKNRFGQYYKRCYECHKKLGEAKN